MSARIVFGMQDTDYFAVPALSQSLAKELLVSPLDGWWASWMNPARPSESETQTDSRLYGKALHKRLLEGREAFDSTFCARPNPEDHPEALRTADDIKAALRDIGEKVGGTKDDLKARLIEAGTNRVFWDDLAEELTAGRATLKADWIAEIEARARILDAMPDVRNAIKDGMPEVSVFWTEETEYGPVPCKARFDYLRRDGFVLDLKSFDNYMRRPLETAVGNAMASGKYHLQAIWYLRACERLLTAFKGDSVGAEGEAPDGYLSALAEAKRARFGFLFVQSEGAPNILFREVAEFNTFAGLGMQANSYVLRASEAMKEALRRFGLCAATFGDSPWIAPDKPRAFTDEDLPIWMQDSLVA